MIGSLLGGPIVTGWLMATNYNHLNLREKKLKLWLLCIASMVVIVLIGIFIPQIPSVVFIFVNAACGQYMATNLQGKLIADHVENGGALYSTWRAVGISLIVALIYVGLMILAFYMQDSVVAESPY